MFNCVNNEVGNLHDRCLYILGTAKDCLNAGFKFTGIERFHKVVIGSKLKTMDAIFNLVVGGKEKDGC
jgi:hypothetical protein